LVVSVDELVFKFADLKNEDSKFVGDIGHIFVTFLAPDRELTGNLSTFTTDQLH
jgi:hypothetical protein